ncbi:MAG: hypothetical protein JRN52_13065 [Nitrososphaerota archaeon]|nr:hypothetical protein [Nitrososphaerota archaeon]
MEKKRLSKISLFVAECVSISIFDQSIGDIQSIFRSGSIFASQLLLLNAGVFALIGITGYWIYMSFENKSETEATKETVRKELKEASRDFYDDWPRIRAVVAEYAMAPWMQRNRLTQIGTSFKNSILHVQESYSPFYASIVSKDDVSEEFVQKRLEARKVQATVDRFSALSDRVLALGHMLEKITPDFKDEKGWTKMGEKILDASMYKTWTKKYPDSSLTKDLEKRKNVVIPILITGDEIHSELEKELNELEKL